MSQSQSGNSPTISQSPMNTQDSNINQNGQDNNINLNDQDLEDASILKDMEEEDVDADVGQSRSKKRKFEKMKRPRSIHWKDYIRVKVVSDNPPIEMLKGKCKRCGTLIAADLRWCGTNGLKNHTISCLKKLAEVEGNNKELEVSDDHEISSMAMKMRVKIGKYWAEDMNLNPRMNKILYIAAVLDLRQKMNHVETCFKEIYGDARGEFMIG
ncbi:hypothetical protein AAHA92_25111 [Salvia divinorum]|uniref:hAT-like transposase RNase-H fold domain-containing protein n=1 Tax=Salvia divinorum TaxID=28513 RepID=A0ABD1GCP2_SALDI